MAKDLDKTLETLLMYIGATVVVDRLTWLITTPEGRAYGREIVKWANSFPEMIRNASGQENAAESTATENKSTTAEGADS